MNRVSWWLLILLALSLVYNLVQYRQQQTLEQSQNQIIQQPVNDVSSNSGSTTHGSPQQISEQLLSSMQEISDDPSQKSLWLEQCEKWMSVGELSKATDFIQRYLQQYPRDIDFLLLEARLIEQTNHISYALAHYYSVLDLPLSEEQHIQVSNRIDELVKENIDKLRQIRSWDILATFLEPLWQFDPTNRDYILNLSEAYAQQKLSSLMEYVLASILPDDPEAIRIRRLIDYTEIAQGDEDDLKDPPAKTYDRSVVLEKVGTHFIVGAKTVGAQVRLMIDTGATTTVLSQRAFNRISQGARSEFVGEYIVNTAGGQVQAPIYRFRHLSIADYRVEDIAIIVLPLEEFNQADGLLGMNFLKEFDFRIDQKQSLLHLSN